jgi:hypothetical protein
MSTTSARIMIELHVGADPIRGAIDHADGRHQQFWGWLELIDELRRIAAGPPETAAGANQHQRPTTTEAHL